MIYHELLIDVPLYRTFNYSHPVALETGRRVAVRFRNREVAALVLKANVTPTFDTAKILPITQVFDERLPDDWLQLVDFAARYYHYPLGATAFLALGPALRLPAALTAPKIRAQFQLSLSALAFEAAPVSKNAKRQAQLWDALKVNISLDKARRIHPQAASILQKWQAAGYVQVLDTIYFLHQLPPCPVTLNDAQTTAVDTVKQCEQFQPFLLYGITGSGKTEVYFEMAVNTLKKGQQVLFMLPEISLTPQFMSRLAARFPNIPTALLHSGISKGERTHGYLQALNGEAALVVGTRLSVFTPLKNLGLIIVDEEHDSSFKQDSELRYSARDLAIWRAKRAGSPIVLGSATPSLESWLHTKNNNYQLLRLPARAKEGSVLPSVNFIDIKQQTTQHGLSAKAVELLERNFQAGGMSMVYLNRRGFTPALMCTDCGHIFGCPNCSSKMVWHRIGSRLKCHHCNFNQAVPHRCPTCGNIDLSGVGIGTQKLETFLRERFPGAKILRIDRDSIKSKNDWDALYRTLHHEGADMLIGTQMLSKGHDFARLNMVIVPNADSALYHVDFRAAEKLFAELMQVSGRAGRAAKKGHVWVQTRLPEHPIFRALKAQNYEQFADAELQARQEALMPPFSYAALIRAEALNINDVHALLDAGKMWVTQHLNNEPEVARDVVQLGPVSPTLQRLEGKERLQIFVESVNRAALHRCLNQWVHFLAGARLKKEMKWSIDVDYTEM